MAADVVLRASPSMHHDIFAQTSSSPSSSYNASQYVGMAFLALIIFGMVMTLLVCVHGSGLRQERRNGNQITQQGAPHQEAENNALELLPIRPEPAHIASNVGHMGRGRFVELARTLIHDRLHIRWQPWSNRR